MESYRVIIPPIVQELIFSQVIHIAEDSIDNALAWEDRLRAAITAIGVMPKRYAVAADASKRLGKEVRKMVFEKSYLVFYHINEPALTVDIVNFRHGARLPRTGEI